MSAGKRVRIYQIFYDEETRRKIDPAFIPLDNSGNERPDWAEYWPIRNLLLKEALAPGEYLGVFSPRFHEKTGVDGAHVLAFVRSHEEAVFSFSPYFEQTALYHSPFHQGDRAHPGLIDSCSLLASQLGLRSDLSGWVADHTTTIFANYFVARAEVWQRWFELAERIFSLCERGDDPLAQRLVARTQHRDTYSYPMKVFIIERLITFVLDDLGLSARYGVNLRAAPRSFPHANAVMEYMIVADALKAQYLRTGEAVFLEQYQRIVANARKRISVLRSAGQGSR